MHLLSPVLSSPTRPPSHFGFRFQHYSPVLTETDGGLQAVSTPAPHWADPCLTSQIPFKTVWPRAVWANSTWHAATPTLLTPGFQFTCPGPFPYLSRQLPPHGCHNMRQVGRDLQRNHRTGTINLDPSSSIILFDVPRKAHPPGQRSRGSSP